MSKKVKDPLPEVELEMRRLVRELRLGIKRFTTVPKYKKQRNEWIVNNILTTAIVSPWGFVFAVLVYRAFI